MTSTNCVNGYMVSLVVELVRVNGTAVLIPLKKYTPCPLNPGPIIAAVAIALLFVSAVLMCMMIIVTVATSFTLKKYLYSHIIVNITVTVICDCFLNMTIAIAYLTTAPWQFGILLCDFSSFSMILITCEMILAILLFVLDRFFVAKKFAPYLSLSNAKLKIIILLTWITSFAIAVPLLVVFDSMPYQKRYSCAIADSDDNLYMIAPLILIMVPVIILIIIVPVTLSIFHKERKKNKKVRGGQTFSYLEQLLMTPYYRNEVYPLICMVGIIIIYLTLWMPFASLITINPIVTSDWFNKSAPNFSDATIGPTQFNLLQRSLSTNRSEIVNTTALNPKQISSMNDTAPSHLIPEMTDTPDYETAFVWFRFIFDFLVPIIILVTVKDIRFKCESLIFCCRPSSVDVSSPRQGNPPYVNKTPKSSGFKDFKQAIWKPRNDSKNMVNYKTPVLFATEAGLHIRTVEDTYLDLMDPKPLLGFAKNNNNDPKFAYEVCDIVLPVEDLTDFESHYILEDDLISHKNVYPYSVDDDEDNIKSFPDSVIIGANAALMSMQPKIYSETEQQHVNKPNNERLESAAKKEIEKFEKERLLVEEKFDETVDLDKNKAQKAKKRVRFDTNNLIQNIPQPSSAGEALDDSNASLNSNDSGVIADDEINHTDTHVNNKKINHPNKSPRAEIITKSKINQPKRVIHDVRNPPSLPNTKKNNVPTRPKRNPTKSQVVPKPPDAEVVPSAGNKRVDGVPHIQNIKSRYRDLYSGSNNGSASSTVSNSRTPAIGINT